MLALLQRIRDKVGTELPCEIDRKLDLPVEIFSRYHLSPTEYSEMTQPVAGE